MATKEMIVQLPFPSNGSANNRVSTATQIRSEKLQAGETSEAGVGGGEYLRLE
jgi:hypothetical protein